VLGSCPQEIDIAGRKYFNDQHLTMFTERVRSYRREDKKGTYSEEQPMDGLAVFVDWLSGLTFQYRLKGGE